MLFLFVCLDLHIKNIWSLKMKKIYFKSISKLLLLLLISISSFSMLKSQSWVSEVSQGGFILKKVVSDTLVQSGQNFSYTIYYTIPAGATNVSISDNLPPALLYLGNTVNSACGTPTVTAPAINSQGGLFSLSWASVPSGCSGSFTITVAFPNGVTCPGNMVRNNACIVATYQNKNYEFCTGYVLTKATASNPWHIVKYPVGLANISGSCNWATGSDTVTYQVTVYKNVGTTGQLNLVNGIVTDTLPAGAVLVSSTCGATQSGNIVTWSVGNMSALPSYNSSSCNISIYYPISLFPSNTNIGNTAVLSGSLGPVQGSCSDFTTSASTCVTKNTYNSGTISKWVYTNGQPGCAGQYLIYICNNGTTSLPVTAVDTVPNTLTSVSLGTVWPNTISATISGNIVNITGSLGVGQCGYVYVNFTIPSNAIIGTSITNCVHLTSIQPNISACNSFNIATPAPKACLWKDICQEQTSYTPGSIFRYRLRIQNIGGQALSGVTLTDVLDPNLEYVGNPSFYISNTWSLPNCNPNPTPAQQWSGVNLSNNPSTNTVTATLPSIPAVCQNIFYSNCGMYGTGGVPYYYIEFDVKVRDTSALGNIPNYFTVSGGSLGNATETSNVEMVLVSGVVGFNLQKGIKKLNDANYSNSITATAGSLINYKLKLNSSGTAALSHITFVDLLPRDVSPADQQILAPCFNRGSQFDISYVSILGTPIPNPVFPYNNTTGLLANINNLLPTGAPGSPFTTGCGTNGTWSSGLTIGDKNMAIYFGSTAVGLTGAEYQFVAKIDTNAKKGENSCNTFAASGWTKHLIQSSILNYQIAGELESQIACIQVIDSVVQPSKCFEKVKYDIVCKGEDPATGNVYYAFTMHAVSCTPSIIIFSSPDGTFSPSSYSITSSPWTISGAFLHTNTTNPVTIYYTLQCNGVVCRDSIKLDLPPCDGGSTGTKDCCKEFFKKIREPKLTWNSATGYVGLLTNLSVGPNPIQKFSATIVSARLKKYCSFSSSTWNRIYGDINSATLMVAPGSGPQLIYPYSREAVWGADSCVDWSSGANLSLNMIFPPYSGGFLCGDSLIFSIRYAFTDCNCVTCDTTITYTIVRRIKFLPWDTNIGFGHITVPGVKDKLQQSTPESTSLVMSDFNNGKFWVISPEDPDNDVVIHGLEFTSSEVKLSKLTANDGSNGTVEGNTAFISSSINPGNISDFDIVFDNPNNLHKFKVYVRFLYTMEGITEPIFSEPVEYTAYVKGVGGDIVGVDKDNHPSMIRTYSIYLHNQNSYKDAISSITLKTSDQQKIIAVGPPATDDNGVRIYPLKQSDNSYIIALGGNGESVSEGSKVVPIFLTISGINDKDPEIEFNTYDELNNIISSGTLQLSNPVAKVNNEGDTPINAISVHPNPANDNITITINSPIDMYNSTLIIRDLSGKVVQDLANNINLIAGTHLYNSNISKLQNGVYFIELNSGNTKYTCKLVKIK